MRAAVFHGPRDVRFEEVPTPDLEPGCVLVRVRACGICGSDLHTYRHGMFLGLGLELERGGRILGHEFSGEVAEIGAGVEGLAPGDRVAVPGLGGNAEFFKVPAAQRALIFRVPDHVSLEEAATYEPLATSVHAVNLAEPRARGEEPETVAILGSGIIGLGVLQVVRARSAARTIVVDLSDRRLEVATRLGADEVINARRDDAVAKIRDLANNGVDVVYDCAGVTRDFTGTSALEQGLAVARTGATVVIVAAFEKPLEIDFNVIMSKGIRLLGSIAWSPEEFVQAMDLVASGAVDRKPLISHEFPLEKASDAYETQLMAEEAVKVLIKP